MAKTQQIRVYMQAEELDAAKAMAAGRGETLCAMLRRQSLSLPARMPERIRIAGADALKPVADALEQALESAFGPESVQDAAFALHGLIMALSAERTAEPWTGMPETLGRTADGEEGRGRRKLFAFLTEPEDAQFIRCNAAACGLSVSAYVRMRAEGRCPQPAAQPTEGIHAIRRAVRLLGLAAMAAGSPELERLHAEADEKRWALEEEEA